ncbi:MAG: amino acid permease [Ignavibacteriae bacterium]|nr:MAG: amino acid permease [Ignavibacteriota bacterium]
MYFRTMSSVPRPEGLTKALGLFTTTMLVIGSVVGSGIFKNPASMAALVGSPELLLAVWVGAGLVTLFGALTIAEIASIIPATGGQYEYFRVIYGDLMAFVYGWSLFFVIQTGSIASITYVFSYYLDSIVPLWNLPEETWRSFAIPLPFGVIYPLQEIGVKLVTAGVIILLTSINMLGVKEGGRIQNLLTVSKILAILVLVGAAFFFGQGSVAHFTTSSSTIAPAGMALVLAIVLTMNKALWAYDGWNTVTAVAGETHEPQKTIPRALMLGSLSILTIYIIINLAYLYILDIDALAQSSSVAADVARIAVGPWGLTFVAISVMISTMGTSNGTILQSARVFFAMAKDGFFFRGLSGVHPRFHTPARALFWQGAWACLLVFSGTFDMLTEMLIFVSWAFYGLAAYGVFILRKRLPEAPRPYRVWGYPLVPVTFVAFAAVFLVFSLFSDYQNYVDGHARGEDPILNSVYGVVIILSGLPFYWWFRKKGSRRSIQA